MRHSLLCDMEVGGGGVAGEGALGYRAPFIKEHT